jgi:hypothetical protein
MLTIVSISARSDVPGTSCWGLIFHVTLDFFQGVMGTGFPMAF